MRKMRFMLGLLALMPLVCIPAWGQNNSGGAVALMQAVIDLTDPVNQYVGNSISACQSPDDAPFWAVNSYGVTLTTAKRLIVGEIDCCCMGDYYEARVDGRLVNRTPNPCPSGGTGYCPAGTGCWGCRSGSCIGVRPVSAGQTAMCLPAGTYRVTVSDPGFYGHSAADIAAEGMCSAGITDYFSTTEASDCSCREIQLGVIVGVPDESTFKNHGQYVSAAAAARESLAAAVGATLSEACNSCIQHQFARSVPQDEMLSCDNP